MISIAGGEGAKGVGMLRIESGILLFYYDPTILWPYYYMRPTIPLLFYGHSIVGLGLLV